MNSPTLEQIAQAVAQVESSGNPYAVNPTTNASGLMQILESTAKDPGYGIKPMDWNMRFDPEESMRLGSDYLDTMHGQFGSWDNALGAYHAGPGTMEDVLAGKRALPDATVQYIDKVFAQLGLTPSATTPKKANLALPPTKPTLPGLRPPAPMVSLPLPPQKPGIAALVQAAVGKPMNLTPAAYMGGQGGSGGAKGAGPGGNGARSRQDPRGDQRNSSNPGGGLY